jgi:hypothetical protein
LSSILIILCGALFIYLLVIKPELIAILFFTITIADINFELGGLPLNIRAAIGLALFGRTLISGTGEKHPAFLSDGGMQMILAFVFYTVLITAMYDLMTLQFIKQTGLTLVAVYTAWYYFFKRGNLSLLTTSLIISGVICFLDLLYTYAVAGDFPVQRVFLVLMKAPVELDEMGNVLEIYNHNFFGQVCGMCFIYLFNEFINNRVKNKFLLALLPVMGLGILMSTSRSTLLATIVISFILLARELRHHSRAKRVYNILGLLVVAVFMALFVFTFMQDTLHLSSEFMDSITNRLIDEPIQVLNKALGRNYNVQQLGAMDWREEAAAVAWDRFLDLRFVEQMFGIGTGGFLARHLGHLDLNPHNGPLLLVIESGIVGLIFYFLFLANILRQSFKWPEVSSCALVTIFVLIFCIGQNEELTSYSTLIFVASLIAETRLKEMGSQEEAIEQQHAPSIL